MTFSLVVNGFGVNHAGKEHIDHLITLIKEHYEMKGGFKGDFLNMPRLELLTNNYVFVNEK